MDPSYRGTPIKDLHKGNGPWKYETYPINPSKYHSVLFELPVGLDSPPKPHVSRDNHHWEEGYVRMPFSKHNLYPLKNKNGKDTLIPRWELIEKAFSKPIKTTSALELAISTYNSKLSKFTCLQYLFLEIFSEEETEYFFEIILPGIIDLALSLPKIIPGNIPLLQAGVYKSLSLSQLQVASLLANAFLCTFPIKKDYSAQYPGINFSSLFAAQPTFTSSAASNCVVEKLKCIINYFKRVLQKPPVGVLTFKRKLNTRSSVPRWDKVDSNLGNTRVHISTTGMIEDDALGLLQVDFANKLVGGGVLSYGCVQEEIRFMICPEMIVSRLFTEKLGDMEALLIIGAERYSKYKGYGDSFEWSGDYKDETPYDNFGRRRTSVIAIDAIHFNRPHEQFNSSMILRELNKAFTGFSSRLNSPLPAVATGNWGCGAFRGDSCLKFLVQLMASSASNRDLVYFTFSNQNLTEKLYNFYLFLATNKITICELWRLMCRFTIAKLSPENFFPFIQQSFFDAKTPIEPTIKNFFLSKKSPSEGCSLPSTSQVSANKDVRSPEKEETVESPEREFGFKKGPEKAVTVKRKRVKSNDDVINLIKMIDGEEIGEKASTNEGNSSFLESIDCFVKKKNEMRKKSSEEMEIAREMSVRDDSKCLQDKLEMDVDEILLNLSNNDLITDNSGEATVASPKTGAAHNSKTVLSPKDKSVTSPKEKNKRKITDYFIKS